VDRATGGDGADMFEFSPGYPRLVITDFDAGEGDRVVFVGIDPAEFEAWTITSVAGGTAALVSLDGAGEIRFDGVAPAEVDQGWFV
jgi:hypothetical protein